MDLAKHSGSASRVATACFITSLVMTLNSPQARSATQAEILQSCVSCHGPGGNSQVSTTPRLNGQQADYIVARLKKFSTATRNNPHAQIGMFQALLAADDATKASIAKYFASQPPTPPRPGPRAAEGQRIFESGLAADNVIACNQCHGPQGEGHGVTPRIAGQHADYLKAQLRLFNLKFREHILMNPNTRTMRTSTMEALASYLASD